VTTLVGDVSLPGLGLNGSDWSTLKGPIDRFFHVAATTDLGTTALVAERVNVVGTSNAVQTARELWKDGRLGRYIHFSTAYIAGGLGDHVAFEDDLPEPDAAPHANAYEASKCAAECLVRQAAAVGLPTTIIRPSIVVGDSQTGVISSFSGIYALLRLWAYGVMKRMPAVASNPVNLVPIDYVTRASLAVAARDDAVSRTYHLVASQPPTIAMILEAARRECPSLPPMPVGNTDRSQDDDATPKAHPLLTYLNCRLRFDISNTMNALAGTGIASPVTDLDFVRRQVRFAITSGYLA
jgi:thioester reductase-like protein